MSYFVVGVGGTGAKFVESMIHLSAAGLLGDVSGKMRCLLVDPDVANGNVSATRALAVLYERCSNRKKLQCGSTDLFRNEVALDGPWTPVVNPRVLSLNTFFGYPQMRGSETEQVDADLMELLFSPEERDLPISQGFRGRPAIGSTIFGKAINFRTGAWGDFIENVRGAAAGQATVPVVLAGSVFGGSGAAGVPTICRLLGDELRRRTKNVRLGLVLFLPYFRFKEVPGEVMQADSGAFSTAAAESLKYYDEGRFLDTCHSIYALGEETPAEMRTSAIGAEEQKNDPHFLELVAGLAATGFIAGSGGTDEEHTLSLAVREKENTVRWADLPTAKDQHEKQIKRLQHMTLFAVAFRFIFYPNIVDDLKSSKPRHHFVVRHITRQSVTSETALRDLGAVSDYVNAYLEWLLNLSTPGGLQNYVPGLVKLDVFAMPGEDRWRLKQAEAGSKKSEFQDRDIENLFLNADGKVKPRFKDIWNGADVDVVDPSAAGTGRLVRALYDACRLG